MAEEIEIKKAGKGRSLLQQKRNAVINSNTRLGTQASVISPKTNIIGRSYLTPNYLTQAKIQRLPNNLLTAVVASVAPNQMGDGTMKAGTIEKAQAEAARKAKRRPSSK
jgi:hypothetical protein